MAVKNSSFGLVMHIVITVVGVVLAFIIGLKAGGSGKGDIDKQLGDLKSDIKANADGIKETKKLTADNKKLVDDNKRLAAESIGKVNTLASTVSSLSTSISNNRPAPASTGRGMNYVDSVLGLNWVTRPTDGHKYCLIPYPLPWKLAQEYARKVGGSLVVINDEQENKWIVEKFGSDTEYWIGLSDERDEAKFVWVDDSDLVYKNWAIGEPDNYKKMQHFVIMNKQAAKGAEEPGKWNDVPGNEVKIGIIEVAR